MWTLLVLALAAVTTFQVAEGQFYGNAVGTIYRLNVRQDVAIEGASNHNGLPWLLVGKHTSFPNKRSLIQTVSLPQGACNGNNREIVWAKLYVYFAYAHKASFHSQTRSPWRSRPIQVYQVNKRWLESQATRTQRTSSENWEAPYGEIIEGKDAGPDVLDTTTVFTRRPSGWIEWDVTQAVLNWRAGAPNYGFLLRAETEFIDGRGIRFYSNAFRDRSKHAYVNVLCGPRHGQHE